MAVTESYNLLVGGDTIGNAFLWNIDDIEHANTEDGEVPLHLTLGGVFQTKRCAIPEVWYSIQPDRHDMRTGGRASERAGGGGGGAIAFRM